MLYGCVRRFTLRPRDSMARDKMSSASNFSDRMKEERCSILLDQLRKCRENEELCDIVLFAEDERINAHKCVLIAGSEYFRGMLTGDFIESKKAEIKLPDVSKTDLKYLLDFMYGKRIDFETKSVEELISVWHLADRLCVDTYTSECEEFLSNLKDFLDLGETYLYAKKFEIRDVEKDLKSLFLHHLIPKNLMKPLKDNERALCLKDAPYDLIRDTLMLFETPECIPEYGLLRSPYVSHLIRCCVLMYRIENVSKWIALHPNETMAKRLTLLDLSGLVSIPPSTWPYCIRDLSVDQAALVADAFRVKLENIMSTLCSMKVRFTWIDLIGKSTANIADYDLKEKIWKYYSITIDSQIDHYAADGDHVFMVSPSFIYVYELGEKSAKATGKVPFPVKDFQCKRIFPCQGILYLYGKNTTSKNVTLGIFNKSTEEFQMVQLKFLYLDYWVPALTADKHQIYFKNGNDIYSYRPTQKTKEPKVMNRVCKIALEKEPILSVVGKDLFVFQKNGSYVMNPSRSSYQPKRVQPAHTTDSLSSCLTDFGLVMALYNNAKPERVELLQRVKKGFKTIGYLPDVSFRNMLKPVLLLRPDGLDSAL